MSEPEAPRLVAWGRELREVHARLREARRVTQDAPGDGQDRVPYRRGGPPPETAVGPL